jgi:serine/threonine protein kinase
MMITVSSCLTSCSVAIFDVCIDFYFIQYNIYQIVLDHLNTRGNFPENVVRFWTAELASGLAYLHSKGIMHR